MDRSVTALLVPDEVGPNPANVSARGVVVGLVWIRRLNDPLRGPACRLDETSFFDMISKQSTRNAPGPNEQ